MGDLLGVCGVLRLLVVWVPPRPDMYGAVYSVLANGVLLGRADCGRLQRG